MGEIAELSVPCAHAVMLPFPLQGHINPLMQLAHILVTNGVKVTFLNNEQNHEILAPHLISTDRIRFLAYSDGLPADHGRVRLLSEFADSLLKNIPIQMEKIIEDCKSSSSESPVSIIITDGVFSSIVNRVSQNHGLPWISFWTPSASGFAAYHATPILKQHSVIPLPEEERARRDKMHELVGCLAVLEELRVKDLPSFFTMPGEPNRWIVDWLSDEGENTHDAEVVIINTWDGVEGAVVDELNKVLCNRVMGIGPLTLFAQDMASKTSLWEEAGSCLAWLDKQAPRSVIYVGFGSIALLDEAQLDELASGLEMSGQPFLWVIRPDLINGVDNGGGLPKGYVERCGDRACFVSWAPQRKVLNHPSIAGFLTHCGWNSTVEGICAGVPMMCWPYFAEQQTNRRLTSETWKFGIELNEEEGVKREEIVSGIRRIMEGYESVEDGDEHNLVSNVRKYRDSALKSYGDGGSSHANLQVVVKKVLASAKSQP